MTLTVDIKDIYEDTTYLCDSISSNHQLEFRNIQWFSKVVRRDANIPMIDEIKAITDVKRPASSFIFVRFPNNLFSPIPGKVKEEWSYSYWMRTK